MKQEELQTILHKHDLWLNDKDGGERANLAWANLTGDDLTGANLKGANLAWANLTGADLTGANLTGANLTGADLTGDDLDYASWPLCCGSLKAHVDNRLAIQLLYHTLSVVMYSPNVTPDIKKDLLTETNLKVANQFHRVEECGKLRIYEEESREA